MVSGTAILHSTEWGERVQHGTGGRKRRWVQEEWALKVTRGFQHWCGLCYSNCQLLHVKRTKPWEHGKVSVQSTVLYGSQHWSSDGRVDIEVTLPQPIGKTYLHILAYWAFYVEDKPPFQEWRNDCLINKIDVDHGEKGHWRLIGGCWQSYLNLHALALTGDSSNRGQGENLRARYETIRLRHVSARKTSRYDLQGLLRGTPSSLKVFSIPRSLCNLLLSVF